MRLENLWTASSKERRVAFCGGSITGARRDLHNMTKKDVGSTLLLPSKHDRKTGSYLLSIVEVHGMVLGSKVYHIKRASKV
jgi:hypothetical protein